MNQPNVKRTRTVTTVTGSVPRAELAALIMKTSGAPDNARPQIRVWVDAYEGGRNDIDDGDLKFSVEWEVTS